MSSDGCFETFEVAPHDLTRAKFIDQKKPHCACERCQVSEHCLDPVGSDETLVRIIMDPDHIEVENGLPRLKSSFFSDAASVGASSLRRERASDDEYTKTIEMILQARPTLENGKPRRVYGVVTIPVSLIKAIKHEAEPAKGEMPGRPEMPGLCVYATGEQGRPNHADIMTNGLTSLTRSKALKAGKKLTEAVSNSVVLAAAFRDADLTSWSA